MPTAVRSRFSSVVAMLAVPPALAVLAGAFGSRHWLCDLCAHTTAQCAAALLLATAWLLVARRFGWALALAPATLVATIRTVPLFFGGATAVPPAPTARSLRVATVNLLATNHDHAAVLAALRSEPFDLIATSELTHEWLAALQPLRAEFPYSISEPDWVFGIALWSRHPLRAARVQPLGYAWAPCITAIVQTPHGDVSVLIVHPPRPGLTAQPMTDERDRALAAVPALLAELPAPRLLLGDCNATRWSRAFAEMLAATQLVDTADGQGWQPTWPVDLPSLLRIPIDQILVEPGIAVRSRRIGPDVGSDHLPVFAELLLPPR